MKSRLKINGFIIFIAVILIAFFPALFLRNAAKGVYDGMAEIFGIAFILLGQLLRVSSRGYKSEYSKEGNLLIQSGPYAVVRNPMYLGILLIGLGIVAMLFKWWVACIFLLVFIIRYLMLVFKEENKLMGLFGQAYRDYCNKVPRILPSIAKIARTDVAQYMPLRLSWLKKEIGTISAVLLTAVFFESWEDIKNEGLAAYFKEAAAIIVVIALFIILVVYLSKKTGDFTGDVSGKSKTHLQ
jgi:protein-S-isoprenylcysteine O-methyltransferase Ste14